jgi:transposase
VAALQGHRSLRCARCGRLPEAPQKTGLGEIHEVDGDSPSVAVIISCSIVEAVVLRVCRIHSASCVLILEFGKRADKTFCRGQIASGNVVHQLPHERNPAHTIAELLRQPEHQRNQRKSEQHVRPLWQSHNLKPHRVKTFKLSRDAKFLEKLTDVVGLYLNPPQQAIVLCVDEKSQIQALDRTQPGLPMKKGRCGTMTHDYKRNGTTSLFAALEVLQGRVIGQCYERHRHQEFLQFLRRLDQEFPGEVRLHLVMDNYGTHKQPKVQAWLKRHPRFVSHFVPTSSSWLNLVERWFGELTSKRIRRGSFRSVEDLEKAIPEFMAAWNENPRPFVWTATVESIVQKLSRCRQTLEQIRPGCTLPRRRKTKS